MPTYAYGFLIGIVLVVIFWFLFVAPMERKMHERKMRMMKRKLERNEERLRQLSESGKTKIDDGNEMPTETDGAPSSDASDGYADRP